MGQYQIRERLFTGINKTLMKLMETTKKNSIKSQKRGKCLKNGIYKKRAYFFLPEKTSGTGWHKPHPIAGAFTSV